MLKAREREREDQIPLYTTPRDRDSDLGCRGCT